MKQLSLFLKEVIIFERFVYDKNVIVAEAEVYFEAKDYSAQTKGMRVNLVKTEEMKDEGNFLTNL